MTLQAEVEELFEEATAKGGVVREDGNIELPSGEILEGDRFQIVETGEVPPSREGEFDAPSKPALGDSDAARQGASDAKKVYRVPEAPEGMSWDFSNGKPTLKVSGKALHQMGEEAADWVVKEAKITGIDDAKEVMDKLSEAFRKLLRQEPSIPDNPRAIDPDTGKPIDLPEGLSRRAANMDTLLMNKKGGKILVRAMEMAFGKAELRRARVRPG